MQKIFLAFPGYQVSFKQKIKKIDDFEFWNLEEISEDEFITLIQKKIPPFNGNVKKNYFTVNTEEDFRRSYRSSSWGMLLPNYTKDYLDGRYESLFTVNLFSELNLPVMFYVQKIGVFIEKQSILEFEKSQFHGEDKKFLNKKFIEFYKLMFPALIGIRWEGYEVTKWDREDWRMHVSCLLFNELRKYQNVKYPMIWQAECAEIVCFYEALLSRRSRDNGSYKTIQRIEVLLGKNYKKNFPKLKNDLKELYSSRNDFVHGSFFERLQKVKTTNKNGLTELPLVDFNFLEVQERTAKQVMVVYLYLRKYLKKKKVFGGYVTIPEIIHGGIMDFQIRTEIQNCADKILKLMPFRIIK